MSPALEKGGEKVFERLRKDAAANLQQLLWAKCDHKAVFLARLICLFGRRLILIFLLRFYD
jgi:hypothetical protein